jgi:hypothetical protein
VALPLPEPSDGNLNRALHNERCGMCCAKGGMGAQHSGWNIALELCTRGVEDSGCTEKVQMFEKQQEFSVRDRTSNKPFLNIVDRGHRATLDALQRGQTTVQPTFAAGDQQQFTDNQSLCTACISVLRSGDGRHVRLMKMSWLLSHGCLVQAWNLGAIADFRLTCGF